MVDNVGNFIAECCDDDLYKYDADKDIGENENSDGSMMMLMMLVLVQRRKRCWSYSIDHIKILQNVFQILS